MEQKTIYLGIDIEKLWETIKSSTLQADTVTVRAGKLRFLMPLDQLENL